VVRLSALRAGRSLYVYPILVYVLLKSWSECSQSSETVNYCMIVSPVGLRTEDQCADEGQQQFTVQDWTVHPRVFARQRLSKHVHAVTKKCWMVVSYAVRMVSRRVGD
jgi:hypothetical protein